MLTLAATGCAGEKLHHDLVKPEWLSAHRLRCAKKRLSTCRMAGSSWASGVLQENGGAQMVSMQPGGVQKGGCLGWPKQLASGRAIRCCLQGPHVIRPGLQSDVCP